MLWIDHGNLAPFKLIIIFGKIWTIYWINNQKHRPVMIHRAPFGSWRFVALLIEHTGGKFPLAKSWTIYHTSFKWTIQWICTRSFKTSKKLRYSRSCWWTAEKIGRKIRDAELNKIPFMLIVGEKETKEKMVSVRQQGEGDLGSQ